MQYFISWTHSDPHYHTFLPDLGVLVSPPNVNLAWTVNEWSNIPTALIIDSGAYQYAKSGRSPAPSDVLARQLRMLADVPTPASICHLDIAMLGTHKLAELDQRIIKNLVNAAWLISQQVALPENISPIGVIQGYTPERIYTVAQTLADMGYTRFALGSLARMVANNRDDLLRRVEAAMEAVGTEIHVLGVSAISVLSELARLGIVSADSGTPMHEAWRGGILYSRPLRRYKIASPHFHEWRRTYNFAELLSEPFPCDCPVCVVDSTQIMQPRGKAYVNQRAIHNCYHLLEDLKKPL